MNNIIPENLNIELKELYELRHQLAVKKIKFRKEKVYASDTAKLNTIEKELKDIESEIFIVDNEISEVQNKINNLNLPSVIFDIEVEPNKENEEEIRKKLLEVWVQDQKKLELNLGKEEIKKILETQKKLSDILFKDFDKKLAFLSKNKDGFHSSALFDKISGNEELDSISIQQINLIRNDTENYKWHDRSLIISSLILSLLKFKFKLNKAQLLLDFINDFEDENWQRALSGLLMSLIYHPNSWNRFNEFQKKLKILQKNKEIQEGIKIINFILMNKLYEINVFYSSIYHSDFIKEPIDCFLPFYENNQIFNNALDSNHADLNNDHFKNFILKMPFIDSYKYVLCHAFAQGKIGKENKKENLLSVLNSLQISDLFMPYQNIITEFYCFCTFYPENLNNDVFKKELILTNTKLKDYILEKVMELLLVGNTHYHQNNYTQAINKYLDLLKIEPNHIEAQMQIANSNFKLKKYNEAVSYYHKVYEISIEKNNKQNKENLLLKLAICNKELKKFHESLKYCQLIEELETEVDFEFLALKAECTFEIGEIEKASNLCLSAEKIAFDNDDFFSLAQLWKDIKKHDRALTFAHKILETNEKDIEALWLCGYICIELRNWSESIKYFENAIQIDEKNAYSLMSLGRAYLFSNDLILAKNYLNRALRYSNKKKHVEDITYGNLGHLEFVEGNYETAFNLYLKCIELLEDVSDFEKKYDSDTDFIVDIGVKKEDYLEMKQKVINTFNTQQLSQKAEKKIVNHQTFM